MKKIKFILNWLVFITGLFLISFGVALSVKADLGISPISCVPYVFSLIYSPTIGQITVIFNLFIIMLQIVLLRKKYSPLQLVQLPVIFLFGAFIDLSLLLISDLSIASYFLRFVVCLLSCAVIAFGVFIEVKARVTYLPGEGLALAISETFNVDFGKAKIGTDSAMVAIGIISSLVLIQSLKGIREGTVVTAILTGYLVKYFNRKLSFMNNLSATETSAE